MLNASIKQPRALVPSKAQDLDNSTYLLQLYSKEDCHYCHRVRLALEIKQLNINTTYVESPVELPEEVRNRAPIDSDFLPILVERDFIITQPDIIMQYIDERFPTPPLMPISPQERVKLRTIMHYVDNNIIRLADAVMDPKNRRRTTLVREFNDRLIDFTSSYFEDFNPKEYTIDTIDCALIPLIWRLDLLGVKIPNRKLLKYQSLINYMNFVFSQPSVTGSCTEKELEIYSS